MNPQPSSQPQAADVNAVYAGIVDTMRELLSKIDSDGPSADLEAALTEQGCLMVRSSKNIKSHSPSHCSNLSQTRLQRPAACSWHLMLRNVCAYHVFLHSVL